MEWVIKKMLRPSPKTLKHNANHAHIERKLKLCPSCDMVWSIATGGHAARYTGMPTYGLKRIKCTICK